MVRIPCPYPYPSSFYPKNIFNIYVDMLEYRIPFEYPQIPPPNIKNTHIHMHTKYPPKIKIP